MDRFCELLLDKNRVMNLSGATERDELMQRHVEDSLELLKCCDFKGKSVIDVGCGAGFPGVPLKIAEPEIRLTLLDSLNKRIDFLRDVVRELRLENVECVCARAEEFSHGDRREYYDIAVSRAVASLPALCELCLPFVKVGGFFLAMKSCDSESAESAISALSGELCGEHEYTLYNRRARVLIIKKLRETDAKYPRRFARILKNPL